MDRYFGAVGSAVGASEDCSLDRMALLGAYLGCWVGTIVERIEGLEGL